MTSWQKFNAYSNHRTCQRWDSWEIAHAWNNDPWVLAARNAPLPLFVCSDTVL